MHSNINWITSHKIQHSKILTERVLPNNLNMIEQVVVSSLSPISHESLARKFAVVTNSASGEIFGFSLIVCYKDASKYRPCGLQN